MSSKRKYTTVGMAPELLIKIQEDAKADQRSKGFIVEKILREHYKMPLGTGEKRISDADQP